MTHVRRLFLLLVVAACCLAFSRVSAKTGALYVEWWGKAGVAATDAEVLMLQRSVASTALVDRGRVHIVQAATEKAAFFVINIIEKNADAATAGSNSAVAPCITSEKVQRALVGATVLLDDDSGRRVVVGDFSLSAPRQVVEFHSSVDQFAALFQSSPSLIGVLVLLLLLSAIGLGAAVTYCMRSRRLQQCCAPSTAVAATASASKKAASNEPLDGTTDEEDSDEDGTDSDDSSDAADGNAAAGGADADGRDDFFLLSSSNNKNNNTADARRAPGRPGAGAVSSNMAWWQEETPPVLLRQDDALSLGCDLERLAAATGVSADARTQLFALLHDDAVAAMRDSPHLAAPRHAQIAASSIDDAGLAAADGDDASAGSAVLPRFFTSALRPHASQQHGSAPSAAALLAAFTAADLGELLENLDVSREDERAVRQLFSLACACHAWRLMPAASSQNRGRHFANRPHDGDSEDDAEDADPQHNDDDDLSSGDDDDDGNDLEFRRLRAAARRRFAERVDAQRARTEHQQAANQLNKKLCCSSCC